MIIINKQENKLCQSRANGRLRILARSRCCCSILFIRLFFSLMPKYWWWKRVSEHNVGLLTVDNNILCFIIILLTSEACKYLRNDMNRRKGGRPIRVLSEVSSSLLPPVKVHWHQMVYHQFSHSSRMVISGTNHQPLQLHFIRVHAACHCPAQMNEIRSKWWALAHTTTQYHT